MKHNGISLICAVALFVLASLFQVQARSADNPIGSAVIDSLRQSITDEIYAYGNYVRYADVGEPAEGSTHKLHLYVMPSLHGSDGWVIYKLMPVGEVYREFSVLPSGRVILRGDISGGFPPTQPSYLTVYMSDSELCEKKAQWRNEFFFVDVNPATSLVKEARRRYGSRTNSIHK